MNLTSLLAGLWMAGASAAPAPPPAHRFFTIVRDHGRYWFAAPPDGRPFYSMGVDVVRPDDTSPAKDSPVYRGGAKRGGLAAWAAFTADRLKGAGFNTIGAWSDPAMERQALPYCVALTLGVGAPHRLMDLWDPRYAARMMEAARTQVGTARPKDPLLIGYFLDNELPWYGAAGWPTAGGSLLETYLGLADDAPGRRVAGEFLAARAGDSAYLSIRNHKGDWERQLAEEPEIAEAFAGKAAARFMTLAVRAVRAVDTRHLILGVRFAGDAPAAVIHAVGEASDAISVDYYIKSGRPEPMDVDRLYLLTGKPVLVTEFSWRAVQNRSGDRNLKGADVTVATQADRARRYTRSVERLAALPEVIGFHWFQYFDQPPGGRFDGEDSNYGIVDLEDEPYEPLWSAMRDMNGRVAALHAASPLALPVALGDRRPESPLPVAGVDVQPELGRTPFPAFPYAAWPGRPVQGATWGDPASRCEGTFTAGPEAGVFHYSLNGGWGCGVDLVRTPAGPIDVAGARRLVARLRAPRGVRFRFVVKEDGIGPREAAAFAGARGADGEQYISDEVVGTGAMATVTVALSSLHASPGFGNPAGNEQLDAQALAGIGLHVTGGTPGPGELALAALSFE